MSDDDEPLNNIRSERMQKSNRRTATDVKLIRLVRAHRPLYEADDSDYHNQLKREEIWNEIAKSMGRKLDECRRRWFNIRDCFRKSLKKRQNREYDSDMKSRPIRLESELTFMIPHLRSKRLKRFPSSDDLYEAGETAEIPKPDPDYDPLNPANRDMEYVEGEPEPEESLSPEPLKEEQAVDDEEAAAEIHDILHDLAAWRREEMELRKDQMGIFFKTISDTVRSLPWSLQIEAKKKISAVVYDLELKAPKVGSATNFNARNEESLN